MIEYLYEYLLNNGVTVASQGEEDEIISGIKSYLADNGIRENATGEYFKMYIKRHFAIIAPEDLKSYVINYNLIRNIQQIVIENRRGQLEEARRYDLYRLMGELYDCGLGDRYVPMAEIQQILGPLV